MKKLALGLVFIGASALMAGCATTERPVVYQKDMNQQQANQAIQQCESMASQSANPNGNKKKAAKSAAKRTGGGAAIGGMLGAASGGDGLKGAGLGAAAGASTSILGWMFNDNDVTPQYKSVVNSCLRDKGYQVKGWQ